MSTQIEPGQNCNVRHFNPRHIIIGMELQLVDYGAM
jgi:hypothetical protein